MLSYFCEGGVAMKNHIWQDGKLLQTNKKWSHLKERQRSWIHEITREEHAAYVAEHGRLPMKKRKEDVLDKVHERVVARDIWIPYGEFRAHVYKAIDRLNHKSPLFVPPKKKPAAQKPKTPRAAFEEFPAEVQESIKSFLAGNINRYIMQAHRVPTNKIRDNDIKQALRGFNSKQWQPYEMLMQSSDMLIKTYNELRESAIDTFSEMRELPQKISKHQRDRLRSSGHILETDRLILRKMSGRDYKDIREMLTDPDVMNAWEHTYSTKKEVMAWIIRQLRRYEKDLVGYYAAIDKKSGQMVGQMGLMWSDIQGRRCLEVGYILKKAYWGKGYATEGAEACLSYGFSLFSIEKIYATIRPENQPAIAVAERLGMKHEAVYTKKYDGKPIRYLIYTRKN